MKSYFYITFYKNEEKVDQNPGPLALAEEDFSWKGLIEAVSDTFKKDSEYDKLLHIGADIYGIGEQTIDIANGGRYNKIVVTYQVESDDRLIQDLSGVEIVDNRIGIVWTSRFWEDENAKYYTVDFNLPINDSGLFTIKGHGKDQAWLQSGLVSSKLTINYTK